jgi:hypothetical protein
MIKKLTVLIGVAACTGLAVIFVPGFAREIDAGVIPFSKVQAGNEEGGLVIHPSDAACPHYSWPYGCDWRPPIGRKQIVKKVPGRHHRFVVITALEKLQEARESGQDGPRSVGHRRQ